MSRSGLVIFFVISLFSPSLFAEDAVGVDKKLEGLQSNLNFLWILLAAAMVFLMQAGFMCVESGYARSKNSINVAIKNMADFILSVSIFWFLGFGLMFGTSNGGWIGTDNFMLGAENSWAIAFFIFQAVFCGTAATIDSGAIVGRAKFASYLVLSLIISGLIYPVFGHWAWGSLLNGEASQGWLEKLGFIDFAGSTVVHSVGGWVALAGLIVIGSRLGRFDKDGKPVKFAPSNLTLAYLGTFILFFGWFGFNCGSTLAADGSIAKIAMNTLLGACFGGMIATALSWFHSPENRPEGEHIANGLLGGLVGITAGCEILNPIGAVFIGAISGAVSLYGVMLMEKMKLDDVVSAVAVHGMCGAWGTVGLAFFMPAERLGETARMAQVGVQLIGVGAAFIWAFGASFILLKTIDKMMGLRVSEEHERMGLNIAEHGARSSVLELVTNMHKAIDQNRYDESLEVPEEIGTEVGDLINGYNKMLATVRSSIAKSEAQTAYAKQESEKAELALENTKKLLAELESSKEKSVQERNRYLTETGGRFNEIISAIESRFGEINSSSVEVSDALQSLSDRTEEITEVLGQIGGISRQTRILSINASIESERAGEAGRTFSAVANEVQKLSSATQSTSNSIGELVDSIRAELGGLVERVSMQAQKIAEAADANLEARRVVDELVQSANDEEPEFQEGHVAA